MFARGIQLYSARSALLLHSNILHIDVANCSVIFLVDPIPLFSSYHSLATHYDSHFNSDFLLKT